MALSREEKEKILKALEEDREFRYAMMGLLGFTELLERFSRLEERQQRLEERQQRLEERQQRLEERQQRLEERQQQLEERMLRLEERLLEVEKRLASLEEAVKGLQRTLATVAHRFGVLSESAFRGAIKGIVEEVFGAKAYRWTTYDKDGVVYGHPSEVEVDVVIRDGKHVLVEVKSRVDAGDVIELARIAKLYEKTEGIKPELAIVAGFVSPKARKLAEKLGIKIYTYLEDGQTV